MSDSTDTPQPARPTPLLRFDEGDAIERQLRVPVDLVATLRSGSRREMVTVSSRSVRGAFIGMATLPSRRSTRTGNG